VVSTLALLAARGSFVIAGGTTDLSLISPDPGDGFAEVCLRGQPSVVEVPALGRNGFSLLALALAGAALIALRRF
jgi:hypothetical protein